MSKKKVKKESVYDPLEGYRWATPDEFNETAEAYRAWGMEVLEVIFWEWFGLKLKYVTIRHTLPSMQESLNVLIKKHPAVYVGNRPTIPPRIYELLLAAKKG